MRRLLLGAWLLVLMMATQVGAQDGELKAKIDALVKDLGADSFNVRLTAQAELVKIGKEAEPAVRAAADSVDVEVSGRARFILAEFAKRKLEAELEKVTWTTILDRVKQHASNNDWQKPGFTDPLIEKAVEKVIAQANSAAGADRVQMPVRFAEIGKDAAVAGPPRPPGRGSQLVCGKGSLEFSGGERSIYLIDGNVRISSATNCLIIARGAVRISHGSGNVVLAGQFIDISHDGSHLRGDPRGPGPAMGGSSLVMSGSILRMSHATQTICSAPDEVRVSSNDCVLLNSAPQTGGGRSTGQRIDKVTLQLQPKSTPNPIIAQLKVTQAYDGGDSRRGFMITEQQGIEVVHRPDAEITDNLGKPLKNLAGWKLAFIADGYALLSNGKEDAGFVILRSP